MGKIINGAVNAVLIGRVKHQVDALVSNGNDQELFFKRNDSRDIRSMKGH